MAIVTIDELKSCDTTSLSRLATWAGAHPGTPSRNDLVRAVAGLMGVEQHTHHFVEFGWGGGYLCCHGCGEVKGSGEGES